MSQEAYKEYAAAQRQPQDDKRVAEPPLQLTNQAAEYKSKKLEKS